jgi:acyl carrier protein
MTVEQKMTIEQIQEVVLAAVCEIQKQSGRPLPEVCCDTLRPIGDLEGFESINAVEVTVQLAEKLGCEIDGNPFVKGHHALKVKEVARCLHQLVNKNGAKSK